MEAVTPQTRESCETAFHIACTVVKDYAIFCCLGSLSTLNFKTSAFDSASKKFFVSLPFGSPLRISFDVPVGVVQVGKFGLSFISLSWAG